VCSCNRYSEDEINRKVSVYRQMLMENLQTSGGDSGGGASAVEKDETGRPMYALLLCRLAYTLYAVFRNHNTAYPRSIYYSSVCVKCST